MKKSLLFSAILLSAFSLQECKENEPAPMIWKFSDFDQEAVSAVFSPQFYTQVSVYANSGFQGELTLTCTNYDRLTLEANTADGTFMSENGGFTVERLNDYQLRISFIPTEVTDNTNSHNNFSVKGTNSKESSSTNISVSRILFD